VLIVRDSGISLLAEISQTYSAQERYRTGKLPFQNQRLKPEKCVSK